MPPQSVIKFQLPQSETAEVYLVKLADGRVVARTRDELVNLPPGVASNFQLGGSGEGNAQAR